MTKRLFGSLTIAGVLALLLLGISVFVFSGNTQASNQSFVAANANAALAQADKQVRQSDKSNAPLGVWATVAPFPTVTLTPTPGSAPLKLKRANAAAYHPNGKIYVMGGRRGVDGEDYPLSSILEYTPGEPGTWVQKSALIDPGLVGSRFTANMAVATLTDTNGVRIYAIGGSSTDSLITNTVRVYNPVVDGITTLTSDPWPASPARIPGGWAVYNNKLYIFGGFSALGTGAVFNETWVFDPLGVPGSKWTELTTADLPTAKGYTAGALLDGFIYAAGGDSWNPGPRTLVPLTDVVRMDPTQANPTWTVMASLPTARGDMGAWAYDTGTPYEIAGRLAVAGGVYLVPDNLGYLYNPGTNSWSTFPNLVIATRNYGTAQLNGYLYALGGYDYRNNLPDGANFNQRYDATTPLGTATATNTGTPPTSTRTNTTGVATSTSTVTPTVCSSNYTIATGTATIVAGTTNIGSACDDCVTGVTIPFSFTLYDQSFTTVDIDSNGKAHFPTGTSSFTNSCLPAASEVYTIFPYWDDLRTDGTGCTGGCGIFTSTTGVAPNRIFNIEWRTTYFSGGGTANFELRLYEGAPSRFEVIFGAVAGGNSSATSGVQKNGTSFTQYFCNGVGPAATGSQLYTLGSCGTAGPTGTATRTNTAMAPTSTRTNTVVAPTATCVPTGATVDVSIAGFAFNPQNVTVGVGTSVRWTNNDAAAHTSTSDTAVWDSGSLSQGNQFSFTFTTPGTYPYHCTFHPGMTGTITVQVAVPCATSTVAATITAVATATCAPSGPLVFTGSIDGSEPIHNSVNGATSACGGTTPCPGELLGDFHYDTYPLANTSGAPVCVTVTLSDSACIYSEVYSAVPDPANSCTAYVADSNLGTSYQLTIPANATYYLVVEEFTENAGCGSYTVTVTGLPGGNCVTGTPVVTAVPTSTRTNTVVVQPTSTRTNTVVVVPTSTRTNVPATGTATIAPPSSTVTTVATSTRTTQATAVATATTCTISFSDVPTTHEFYTFIQCLVCRNIVSGYSDGTFKPNNPILRGQIAKMVSNSAGFNEDPGAQIYTDVDSGNPFYQWINRLSMRGHMSGYTCGGPFEPCDASNRPYFRPFANATRGQLSKIVANAAGIQTPVPAGTQTYTDVPSSNTFYVYIERLTALGVMGGYQCGGPGEPCDASNRPYFRPFAEVTRGQASKIVANTFFPGCEARVR